MWWSPQWKRILEVWFTITTFQNRLILNFIQVPSVAKLRYNSNALKAFKQIWVKFIIRDDVLLTNCVFCMLAKYAIKNFIFHFSFFLWIKSRVIASTRCSIHNRHFIQIQNCQTWITLGFSGWKDWLLSRHAAKWTG